LLKKAKIKFMIDLNMREPKDNKRFCLWIVRHYVSCLSLLSLKWLKRVPVCEKQPPPFKVDALRYDFWPL
jgi:hypothetical protein